MHFQPRASAPVPIGDPFGLFIVVDDLQHEGSIAYDDDRDTTPDRFEASEGLGAFELTIAYDPDMVEFRDAVPGPFEADAERSFQCLQRADEAGSVSFGCISSGSGAGPQGDLTLAEFSFEPLAPGATELTLEEAELVGPLVDDIRVSIEDVHPVEITGTAPAQNPNNGPDDPADPANNNPNDPVDDPSVNPANDPADPTGPQDPNSAQEPGENDPSSPSENGNGASQDSDDPGSEDTTGPLSVRDPDTGPDGDGEPVVAEADDGSSATSVLLWSVAVGGGLAALGALGLAGARWRRKSRS